MRYKGNDQQGYFGAPGERRFANSANLASAAAGMLSQMPQNFRKSDMLDKLQLATPREAALLTDALNVLQKRSLIRWNKSSSSWDNLVG